ncbi:MAG: hypothetical protein KGL39_09020 [Patescibacteria group bacterium]|nr:hypothetical protein [Patescibacteria group bacterium]
MAKSDSPSKRSTPSERPFSLSKAMGRGEPPGFGDPGAVKVGAQNPYKRGTGGATGKGAGKTGGVKSNANFDVTTRVHLGGGKGTTAGGPVDKR